MCTADELSRTFQLGAFEGGASPASILPGEGWYSGLAWAFDGTRANTDCFNWGSSADDVTGSIIEVTNLATRQLHPSVRTCDQAIPVLCCD